jgi:hypothetical protein
MGQEDARRARKKVNGNNPYGQVSCQLHGLGYSYESWLVTEVLTHLNNSNTDPTMNS